MFTAHTGKGCPVDPDTMVRVQIRCRPVSAGGDHNPTAAKGWRWFHRGDAGDVAAFEVVR